MTKALQIRLDEKLKNDADFVFESLGLDTPTAIRLFLKKVVASKSIPFDLRVVQAENGFTPEFEEEILKASGETDHVGPFKSADAAIRYLHKHSKHQN